EVILIIGVLKETEENERRVALTPEVAAQLIKQDQEVLVERDAGLSSNFLNKEYEESGAKIAASRNEVLSNSDILLTIQTPAEDDLKKLKENAILICFLWALQHPELVKTLKELNISALGMDA